MGGKEYRLRQIEKRLDEIIENPKDETVGDYIKLQKEYSELKNQIEADENLHNNKDYMKTLREAVTKVVTI